MTTSAARYVAEGLGIWIQRTFGIFSHRLSLLVDWLVKREEGRK